jgi:hypothetical protein
MSKCVIQHKYEYPTFVLDLLFRVFGTPNDNKYCGAYSSLRLWLATLTVRCAYSSLGVVGIQKRFKQETRTIQ